MGQTATVKAKTAPRRRGGAHTARSAASGGSAPRRPAPVRGASSRFVPPRLHLGRLVVLLLVVIAAAFYVAPLRQYFAQQDRHHDAAVALEAARAENAALRRQVELYSTQSYIAQQARSDSILVPPDTQLFVIKGLPGPGEEGAPVDAPAPTSSSLSVLDRLEDLWRTLLR